MARIRIRNEWLERHQFKVRVATIGIIGAALLLAVMARLFYLQVIQHAYYANLAQGNRLRDEPVTPPRGLIFDRNGVLLAENRPSYELEMVPEQVPDLAKTIAALEKIVDIRPEDIKQFFALIKTKRPFQPLPLRTNLSDSEVARFAEDRQDFPGVDIRATLARYYPLGPVAAHVVGYTGIINPSELAHLDPNQYTNASQVGKIGIEGAYENLLHGFVGVRQVETDAQGRVVRVVAYSPPMPGKDLYLTLDIRLQEVAEKALGRNDGAVVAIDPENGQVLAFVSAPSYNPNLFIGGISTKHFVELTDNPDQPLFNRVLRGQYPPGSTLKPFVALAALSYHVVNPLKKIFGPAVFYIPGSRHPFRNWDPAGCGWVDMAEAIMVSCDTYFYNVGLKLGIHDLHQYLHEFGFGQPTGIDLPHENKGLIPSAIWKRRTFNHAWYLGNTAITAIGQGYTLVTPLQLAVATATLSMHGRRFAPQLLLAVKNPLDGSIVREPPHPRSPVPQNDPQAWSVVIAGMRAVVANSEGTGHGISYGAKYSIAAKTGTAQLVTTFGPQQGETLPNLPKKYQDNAMFIAFAPVSHPRIAVAVVVEHGGFGAAAAAPIARKVMDAYLLDQYGGHPPKP